MYKSKQTKNRFLTTLYCEIPINVKPLKDYDCEADSFDFHEYTFNVWVNVCPGHSGYIGGLPENCYEAESSEIEFEEFKCYETEQTFTLEEYVLLVNWGDVLTGGPANFCLSDLEENVMEEWADYNEEDYDDRDDDYEFDRSRSYGRDVDVQDF